MRSHTGAALDRIARAIKADAFPGQDASGGTVDSLTESIMGLTAAHNRIADALEQLAEVLSNGADRLAEAIILAAVKGESPK